MTYALLINNLYILVCSFVLCFMQSRKAKKTQIYTDFYDKRLRTVSDNWRASDFKFQVSNHVRQPADQSYMFFMVQIKLDIKKKRHPEDVILKTSS